MTETILQVEHISKAIKGKPIITDISFTIGRGQVMGFLGPNGAGKSTTLRMVVGLSRPSAGEICIEGHDINDDYVKAMAKVGCIIEGPDFYENMSGYLNLQMLHQMTGQGDDASIMDMVSLVGLQNRIHDKVKVYSMGMKQRLALAAALLHNPSLLILDEPTNGLDPQGIYEFRGIIRKLAEEKGISVLISSHLISEVQLICDHVVIINQGQIITDAKVEAITTDGQVLWRTSDDQKTKTILQDTFDLECSLEAEGLIATVEEDRLGTINRSLHDQGIDLYEVTHKEKTLEDLFLELTQYQTIK